MVFGFNKKKKAGYSSLPEDEKKSHQAPVAEHQETSQEEPSDDDVIERSKSIDQTGFERATVFVKTLHDEEADAPWKQALACFLKYLLKPLIVVAMCYVWLAKSAYKVYKALPMNVVHMIFGLALCHFGGVYFASIAAAEAFRSFGGVALWEELTIIWEEAERANAASEADDLVDANNDGVEDVKQMTANELVSHKARVAMAAVKDPTRLMKAVQFLFSAWLSVIATLKMQFARTVALCLGISSMLELPVVRVIGPGLATVMSEDLHKWIPAIVGTLIRIVAVSIAAFVQSVISAFYSGMRGGKIFAEAFISMLGENGAMEKAPDWLAAKPFDANASCLDELIGLPLAAWGFFFQIANGMQPAFPWNICLLPLTAIEWIIRWNVFT